MQGIYIVSIQGIHIWINNAFMNQLLFMIFELPTDVENFKKVS